MKNRKNFFKFFTQVTRISLTPGDNAAECVLKCDWLSYGKSHVDWSIQTIYLTIFPPFFNALCAHLCAPCACVIIFNIFKEKRAQGAVLCQVWSLFPWPMASMVNSVPGLGIGVPDRSTLLNTTLCHGSLAEIRCSNSFLTNCHPYYCQSTNLCTVISVDEASGVLLENNIASFLWLNIFDDPWVTPFLMSSGMHLSFWKNIDLT